MTRKNVMLASVLIKRENKSEVTFLRGSFMLFVVYPGVFGKLPEMGPLFTLLR